jgi:hypothetical protein
VMPASPLTPGSTMLNADIREMTIEGFDQSFPLTPITWFRTFRRAESVLGALDARSQ